MFIIKTIFRTWKCVSCAAFIFPHLKNLHYRPNPTCLLGLLGKAMSLAKTAREMDLVLHCRSGWFCVCVCMHICVEDGVKMRLHAWCGKDWVAFLQWGNFVWHWAQIEIKSIWEYAGFHFVTQCRIVWGWWGKVKAACRFVLVHNA